MIRRLPLVTLLLLACAAVAWAQCVPETPLGSGNTYQIPCGSSWAQVLAIIPDTLQPGDNVLFQRGCRYDQTSSYLVPSSGTSTNRILFGAYGTGAKPLLHGGTNPQHYGFRVSGKSWITFDGLHLFDQGVHWYIDNSDRVTVRRSKLEAGRAACVHIKTGSDDALFEFNEIAGCGTGTANGEGIYLGTDAGQQPEDDIVLRPVIRYNTITLDDHEAIEGKPGTRNAVVEYNRLINATHGIFFGHRDGVTTNVQNTIRYNFMKGQTLYGLIMRTGGEFHHNVIHGPTPAGRNGLTYGGSGSGNQSYNIHHNTIYDAGGAAILEGTNVGSVTLASNLGWLNGSGNFASNPAFLNPAGEDFRIPTSSPAASPNVGAYAGGEALRPVGHTACLGDEPTPPALVGHWLFNNSGNDQSTANNDGTPSGATYTTSSPLEGTHSLLLDATTDRFSVPTSLFAGPNGDAAQGTVLLSVNASAFAAAEEYLFGCTTSPPFNKRVQLRVEAGKLEVGMGATNQLITVNTPVLTANTTYRTGLRWANGIVELWLGQPGVAVNTRRATATFSGLDAFEGCQVGNNGHPTAPTQGFAAATKIDNVKVWNYALSDTDMLEGETPGTDPDEDPLDLVSCEIGAVANNQAVCTLLNAINPAYCVPNNFTVAYGGVGQTITNAAASGTTFNRCTLTLQNPPASSAVAVAVTYVPTPETVTATNTVSFPTGPGAGLDQFAYRCHEPDVPLNTRWLPSCRVPSPGGITLAASVVNTVGSTKAPQDYELWCSKDGGAAQKVTADCAFGLCLRGEDAATAHGFGPNVSMITPPGGVAFVIGGSFRSSEVPVNQPSIPNNGQIENIWALATAAGLSSAVDFACCQRAAGGIALTDCEPAPVSMKRGGLVRR